LRKSTVNMRKKITALCLLIILFFGCTNKKTALVSEQTESEKIKDSLSIALDILNDLRFPQKESGKFKEAIVKSPSFNGEVSAILDSDPYLWILVDKNHPLGSDYVPSDLVEAAGGSVAVVSWQSLNLRKKAADSLNEMAQAAKKDGMALSIYSAYRSYSYQVEVFARNVREMGRETAEKLSARPGYSQHQLGLTVDFYTNEKYFSQTKECGWLKENASRFGWSLSYPEGYEEVTGYSWESWHYRYVGKETAKFIDDYFNGIQQYALLFLKEFSEALSSSFESGQ